MILVEAQIEGLTAALEDRGVECLDGGVAPVGASQKSLMSTVFVPPTGIFTSR